MIIHCIGDSHANFFNGFDEMQPDWPNEGIKNNYPFFKSFRIGPVLAYNLCKENTTTQGREKLFALLKQIPEGGNILFCFGEIDCRAHVILQAERQKRTAEEVVKTIVDRYVSVLKEVQDMGYNILVWNVIPSAPTNVNSTINVPAEFLFHGSQKERNEVTIQFNQYLKEQVTQNRMFFLNFFNKLLNEDGTTKLEYYCQDDIHLAQKAMPIVLDELKAYKGFDADFYKQN